MLNGPAKITLKNTTKMTLNARFTTIMKSRPPSSSRDGHSSRPSMASEKNRRLAQQMEERTSSSSSRHEYDSRSAPSSSHAYSPRDRAPPRAKPQPQAVSVLDRLGNKPARGAGRGGFRGGYRGSSRGSSLNRTRGGGVRGRFSNGRSNNFYRGGRGRGRGRGGRGRDNDVTSKDDLDAEMDAYIADRN